MEIVGVVITNVDMITLLSRIKCAVNLLKTENECGQTFN